MHANQIKVILLLMVSTLANISNAAISEEQKSLLETLPPDQRASILTKMESAESLETELEDVFENTENLIERPNYKDLEESKRLGDICDDCIFGYDFFRYAPTTFAPVNNIPVPKDYILGPGDKLLINYYGNKEAKLESFVSREGLVFLPSLGPINVTGLDYKDAINLIEQKVESELIGTSVSLSLKELRSMNIYMLGEAYQPGKYTMSGLSSVSNALIVSGGVNEYGSLRNIEVRRNDKVVAVYDFYEFLLKGSLENDIKLLDGDVIFIPFFKDVVKVGGAFKRPAKYELIEGDTIQDAIKLAGGFKTDVPHDTDLEFSFFDQENKTRVYTSVKPVAYNRVLTGESSLNVTSNSSYKVETMKISGQVKRPGDYSIRPGDTILEILKRAGGYTDDAYSEGGVYIRKNVAEVQKNAFLRSADDLEDTIIDIVTKGTLNNVTEFTLSPISRLISRLRQETPLGRMVVELDYLSLKNNPSINFRVQDGDQLFIPKRPSSISVVGEVLSGSSLGFDPRLSVYDYIDLSGGLKDSADPDKIFVILPNGKSSLIKKSFFTSSNVIIPGSTIVVSRDPRPFDAINLTQVITPILADLATSAAAIAAISD